MVHTSRSFKALLLMALVSLACSKKTTMPTSPSVPPADPVAKLVKLPPGWRVSASLMSSFPSGIEVYSFDSLFNGRKTRAYCVAYDSRQDRVELKATLAPTSAGETPSRFFSREPGVVYACINGGFFGSGQSYSLVKYHDTVFATNVKSLTRSYNGTNTTYYPTRAAFGVYADGHPEISWVYQPGSLADSIYAYPAPSENRLGQAPLPVPSASYPAGARGWGAITAIGGSPVLIRNAAEDITDSAELININNTSARARSAIGYTAGGIVMILAVEGNNTGSPDYAGLSLKELADMLLQLGCSQAMNLDGGGSTSFVVANRLTVRPSDNGNERAVMSALMLKMKN